MLRTDLLENFVQLQFAESIFSIKCQTCKALCFYTSNVNIRHGVILRNHTTHFTISQALHSWKSLFTIPQALHISKSIIQFDNRYIVGKATLGSADAMAMETTFNFGHVDP